jgi:perosamine synthetase
MRAEVSYVDLETAEEPFQVRVMLSLIPTEHWDYSSTDIIRGLLRALSPRHAGNQSYILIPGLGPCLPVRSARAGILVALKSLALPPNATVGVPLYCCPVVFEAINAAGCRARFIDVDPDTYCLSATDLAAKSSEVDAVIAVHMFGNVCDMPVLRQAAPGKPFIEDCAQALGSRLNDRLAGSFGEIAAFSFRSGKYLSVGEGGAVYCREAGLESRLSELITALPFPGRVDECVHVTSTYLRSLLRTRPLWGLIGSRVWEAYSANVSYKSQAPLRPEQIFETDRNMAVRRLPLLGPHIERQRSNADYYLRNLTVGADMLCLEPTGAFFNRLQYPMCVPTSQQCDELAARLRVEQISTARPYKHVAEIAAAYYGYTGDCPRAERIARTVLIIPCNYAINAADIERIATCVNRAWAEVGDRRRGMGVLSVLSSATDNLGGSESQSGQLESVTEPHDSLYDLNRLAVRPNCPSRPH